MNIEQARLLCLEKPHTSEDMPFGDDLVAFRVAGKIFGCLPLEKPNLLVLKCDPEEFDDLLAQHSSIAQAYHWHKKHWIEIQLDGEDITDSLVKGLIGKAYDIVVSKLTKKLRAELGL